MKRDVNADVTERGTELGQVSGKQQEFEGKKSCVREQQPWRQDSSAVHAL